MAENDSKPQVLLIDDSVDVHRLCKVRLRSEAIDLVSATSGADGLEMAKACAPALILLDLDMPGMDGFEVLRRLKSESATVNVPVIVVSGLVESTDKVTAFDLGAADYVTKPLEFSELRARIRSALRTQRLLSLLSERAEIDGLTGLGNRQQFNRRWEQEFSTFTRYGHPLSVAMFDIDHFKKINDSYGHPAGDEVISQFGQVILKNIRTSDIPCRYGGEEFVLIMPNTPQEDALVVAERIREAMKAIVWPRHPDHNVTVSSGVAGASGLVEGLTKEKWIETCDQALYTAKRSGRNRVVTGSLQPGGSPVPAAKAG